MKEKYCSRCKITGVSFIIYCRHGERTYYHCRECNNNRIKKYYSENKESFRRTNYRSMAKHKEKQAARALLNYAIRKGLMTKPKICSHCFNKVERIQGHHTDYTKPLEVVWLCKDCHADADKKNGV